MKDVEKIIRNFANDIAMQLNPSNDTMKAVRLFSKNLPRLMEVSQKEEREEIRAFWKKALVKRNGGTSGLSKVVETFDEYINKEES